MAAISLDTKNEKLSIWKNFKDFISLVGNIILVLSCSFYRCIVPKAKKSLKNEVVLITGGGKGLGRELALKFAKEEAIVVLWDIDEKSTLSVQSEIRDAGGYAHAYRCDVSNEEEVQQVGKQVVQEVGEVTILVNNAGILQNVFFTDLDSEKIKKTLEVNVLSHFWTVRYFLPRMLENDKGHIVAISSMGGLLGWLFMADYSASKFAVVGLMEVLEEEVRYLGKGENISFTTVCPITMDTGLNMNPTCRIPWVLPLLSTKVCASQIVSAVRREERIISLPRRVLFPVLLQKLFPRKILQLILDYLKYNIVPNNKENNNYYQENGIHISK